jgi:hypothetical protein
MAKYEMDDTKRLMARVKKCLNLANDAGATEGERDNAMRMAHAILAKHNLDLAQVEASGGEAAAAANAAEPRVDHHAIFGAWPWATHVAMAVGELFFCTYVTSRGRRTAFGNHYFIGRTSNAVTAALVAEYVVKSINREGTRRQRAAGEGFAYQRAFCWGAMQTIRRRVAELKKDPAQTAQATSTPGTSLVLASVYDDEHAANRKYMTERWGKLGKGRQAKGVTDAGALLQGRAFGETVSLNAQLK